MNATVITPSARTIYERVRGYLVFVAIVLSMMVIFVLSVADRPSIEPYNIKSPLSKGTQAIARVIEDRGIDVYDAWTVNEALRIVNTHADEHPTLVLINADRMTEEAATAISKLPRVVGFGWNSFGDSPVFPHLDSHYLYNADDLVTNPSITIEDDTRSLTARIAQRVSVFDLVLIPESSYWISAFHHEEDATYSDAYLYVEHFGADSYRAVFASSDILTNSNVDEHGNAALVMNMVTAQPVGSSQKTGSVVFLYVDPSDNLTDGVIIPPFAWPSVALVFIAFITLGIARGRRLGTLIHEDVPSYVPSSETVSGQGRLLHSNHEVAYTAAMLRTETARRLARRLGVDPQANAETLSAALVNAGASPQSVHWLWTPQPATDADLIELSNRLVALEKEIQL